MTSPLKACSGPTFAELAQQAGGRTSGVLTVMWTTNRGPQGDAPGEPKRLQECMTCHKHGIELLGPKSPGSSIPCVSQLIARAFLSSQSHVRCPQPPHAFSTTPRSTPTVTQPHLPPSIAIPGRTACPCGGEESRLFLDMPSGGDNTSEQLWPDICDAPKSLQLHRNRFIVHGVGVSGRPPFVTVAVVH
jgi:hypothetical protein